MLVRWATGLAILVALATIPAQTAERYGVPADELLPPELVLQLGHSSGVQCVTYSPDGKLVASGGSDGAVKLWDVNTGEVKRTFVTHSALSAVSFSNDGESLFGGTMDGSVKSWDTRSGSLKQDLPAHTSYVWDISLSPDGKILASASGDGTVRLWDIPRGELLRTLVAGGDTFFTATFSPDGLTVATGGADKIIRLWEADTGILKRTLQGHESEVTSLAFSPDGKRLGSAGWDDSVRLWSLDDDARPRVLPSASGRIESIRFSPDGRNLGGGCQNSDVLLWSAETGAPLRIVKAHTGWVRSIAFSPDGTSMASGSDDRTIKLWDPHTGMLKRTLSGYRGSVNSLVLTTEQGIWSANGRTVRLWDGTTGSLKPTPVMGHSEEVTALATTHDEKVLVSTSWDGKVSFWNTQSKTLIRSLHAHQGAAFCLSISPDDTLLATGGRDRTVKVWDMQSGSLLRTLDRHKESVEAIAFSPDGLALASGGGNYLTNTREFWIWDPKTGSVKHNLVERGYPIFALAFSPNGATLATGDSYVRIWSARNWGLLQHFGRGHTIKSIRFVPDSRKVWVGSLRGIEVWDAWTGVLDATRTGHVEEVTCFAVSKDGRIIASGSEDGTIRLWLLTTGRELAALLLTPPSTGSDHSEQSLAVTPEGYYDCSTGADHVVKWRFGTDRIVPFYRFEETFRRPDLLRLALSGGRIVEQPLLRKRIAPACAFVYPNASQAVKGNTVRVLIKGTDDKSVSRIVLTVNGIPVPVSTAKPIPSEAKPIPAAAKDFPAGHKVLRSFTMDVPLPPGEKDVILRAVVYDDELNKNDAVVRIRRIGTKPVLGDLYLLCVGISEYRNPNYNLSYAAADADSITALLKGQRGKQYARIHATVLTDENATIPKIRQGLASLAAAGAADTVMVFLSGHGLQNNGKYYFASHGIVITDVEKTCLPWEEVLDALSEVYARKLLFADSCHSGAKLGARQATSQDLARSTGDRSGIVMFASSRGDEFSFEERAKGHGAFTVGMLEAFRGLADINRDGAVTLPEFEIYLPKRVSELTRDLQHPHLVAVRDFNPQTPLVKTR